MARDLVGKILRVYREKSFSYNVEEGESKTITVMDSTLLRENSFWNFYYKFDNGKINLLSYIIGIMYCINFISSIQLDLN